MLSVDLENADVVISIDLKAWWQEGLVVTTPLHNSNMLSQLLHFLKNTHAILTYVKNIKVLKLTWIW